MRACAAIGVDDDLAAGQAAIAVRTTDLELAGRIDVPLGFLGDQTVRENRFRIRADEISKALLRIRRVAQLLRVLVADNDGDNFDRLAVLVAQRDLALRIRLKLRAFARVTHFSKALQNVVRVLQRRRHQLRRFLTSVTEHDALIAGALVLRAFRIDALGDVRGLAVQIAGVLRLLPVEAFLRVADVLHRGAHLRLQASDDFLGESLIGGLVIARLTGADFAGQDDAVGRHHRLARDPRLGVGGQEGVNDSVGDAVGDFVWVPFGHAFAGKDVRASRHAVSPAPGK